ncbi:MAG: DinB family protein [Pyrinomonadaceae bacterium]
MSLFINNGFAAGRLFQRVIFLTLGCLILAFPAQAQTSPAAARPNPAPAGSEKKSVSFTEEDRAGALKAFDETRTEFLNEISELSEAQLNFKTAPDRWSAAEVAEHIILAENLIYGLITDKILKNPAPEGKDNFRVKDRAIWLAITNRSTKFTAPEVIQPKNRWKTKAEILSNFKETRGKTVSFIKSTSEDLRNHFGENPGLGVIDGYQWFLFMNAHTARHLAQIAEIKADPNFPKN